MTTSAPRAAGDSADAHKQAQAECGEGGLSRGIPKSAVNAG